MKDMPRVLVILKIIVLDALSKDVSSSSSSSSK